MTARRTILPLLLLAAGTALLYNLFLQSRGVPVARSDTNPPRYTLNDVDWVRYNDAGQPNLRGHAAQIDYYNNQSATGKTMQVTLLRNDKAAWTATSPSGEMPAGDKRIRLDGKVQLNGRWPDNNQPLRIDTTQLWIDPQLHELSTDAGVTLSSSMRNGNATGLRADWVTRTFNLNADVKMTYDRSTH